MSNVLLKCGGFSSQLANNLGMPVDGDPLWGSRFDYTNPTAVIQTHMDFLSSGAQIILSNTYQASIEGYMKYLGLNREESVKLIGHSVRLAKAAKKKFLSKQQPGTSSSDERDLPLIMASIGPYGACLHDGSEYDGSYAERVTKEELQQWHRVRIDACLAEGVDGLAIETIPIQLEAESLVELLLSDYPKVKFWVSFQCKDEQQLAHGENFADAVLALWRLVKNNNAQEQLLGLGVNCVNPKFVTPLFKSLHAKSPSEASEIPLLVYSNRGEIWDAVKGAWTGQEECVPLENYIPEWIELGARIIGGCCRIYPEDIKRIRQFLDSLSNNNN